MLGVKRDNRDSVHGPMKSYWRRTLGWRNSRVCTLRNKQNPYPHKRGESQFAVNQQADEDDI